MTEKTLRIFASNLLDGISYLHSKGICHRDLNTKNILSGEDGFHVKIIDFGCVGIFDSAKGVKMHGRTGNEAYRAPEIVLGCEYT